MLHSIAFRFLQQSERYDRHFAFGGKMTELNKIDILIGKCKYELERAEDTRDIDRFNYYYAELSRLYRQRKEIIKLQVIGG